jgi:hypothetical protein
VLALVVGAVAISLLSSATTVFASHEFSDVPDSNPFHGDISWMADVGIAEGFPDGSYRPGAAVTRQAMAGFMHRMSGTDDVDPMVNAAELEGESLDEIEPMWAIVLPTGAVTRSSGDLVQVMKIGTGLYQVEFDRMINACAWVASIGAGSNATYLGEINASLRVSNDSALLVDTNLSTGAPSDQGFHVMVMC